MELLLSSAGDKAYITQRGTKEIVVLDINTHETLPQTMTGYGDLNSVAILHNTSNHRQGITEFFWINLMDALTRLADNAPSANK